MVLRPQDVRSRLALVQNPTARMCLRLIDACGWRLTAGTPRPISAIDAPRMRVRVRQGQGGQDRFVPRAPRVWAWLRLSWQRQRPRPWVFPARPRAAPLSPTARHKTVTAVVRQRGLAQEASIHTL
jgi:integrase/recombinase XerD